MNIQPITSANLDDCVSIFLQAYNAPSWNFAWTPEKAKQYLTEYMSTPYFAGFVMYEDEKSVGAAFAHRKTWWTGPQLFIDEFFIAPTKQRLGYGQRLMDHCNLYAKENDLQTLVLMTNKYMPAYKFYGKIAYTTIEQFVFMFKQVI